MMMVHQAVVQLSQIAPFNNSPSLLPPFRSSAARPPSSSSSSPSPSLLGPRLRGPRKPRGIKVSSSLAEADPREGLERSFDALPSYPPPSVTPAFSPVMKGGQFGAFGAVTLEKSKLDLSQQTRQSSPETALGGGGGDIGKKNFHGGGDGGDDGGDDDDYFDDFDDGDEGDEGGLFRRRLVLQELFDRKFVDAVLQEWYRTVMDLPAGFRQAYEMSLISSAQMVRFLSINARPTTTRSISRVLPQPLSRAFIGRLIADPAFLYKLLLEQAATLGCSVWWELKNRKERIKQEWNLALINVVTALACNGFIVWSLAPCRSYGSTFRFDLQNTLQKLPNNVFEKSYPLREFDMQKRLQSFLYKVAEVSLIGFMAGTVQGALSKVSAGKERTSVTIPSVSTNALASGAFLGLFSNFRYQGLCGIDRVMLDHFDVLGVVMFFSTTLRILNVQLGEAARRAWLGVEADPYFETDKLAYNRSSSGDNQQASGWFISKNPIVSGLGFFGTKQGEGKSVDPPKTRRKRIVRKKVASS